MFFHFFFSLVIANPYYCTNDGDYRLANNAYFNLPNGGSLNVAVPQVCYNNIYRPICLSGITQDHANYFCSGYNGMLSTCTPLSIKLEA